MTPYIVLAVGLLMLSAVVTYACWVKARVWVLRQDLFEIRDRLWDAAHRQGYLEDPEYQRARDNLNALIRFAPRFSLPAWRYLIMTVSAHPASYPPRRLPEVREALIAAGNRIVGYVYRQTASGVAYRFYASVFGESAHERHDAEHGRHDAERIVESDEIREIDREYQAACDRHLSAVGV